MSIDWNAVSSIATAFASIATAVGVLLVRNQLKLSKKQDQASFEGQLDEQYRAISMALPVDVLIGAEPEKSDAKAVRELIYNYLDLSNEEVYYRAKGRISNHTWNSWRAGIKAHMAKPAFRAVYEEVAEKSDFSYLMRLIEAEFKTDPENWYS